MSERATPSHGSRPTCDWCADTHHYGVGAGNSWQCPICHPSRLRPGRKLHGNERARIESRVRPWPPGWQEALDRDDLASGRSVPSPGDRDLSQAHVADDDVAAELGGHRISVGRVPGPQPDERRWWVFRETPFDPWQVTPSRHRAKLAENKGWEVVPVQSVERPRDADRCPGCGFRYDDEAMDHRDCVPDPSLSVAAGSSVGDAEAVELVARAIEDALATVEVSAMQGEFSKWLAEKAVAALGGVGRPCEVTDAEREGEAMDLLRDIRATCQGQLDGEPLRATYLGIRNAIDGRFPRLWAALGTTERGPR